MVAEDDAALNSCSGSAAALGASDSVFSNDKPKRVRRKKTVGPVETAVIDSWSPGSDKSKARGRKKVAKKELEGAHFCVIEIP